MDDSDDAPDFDEADFEKHLRNVLDDVCQRTVTPDEAFEAIMTHPAMRLKVVGPLEEKR